MSFERAPQLTDEQKRIYREMDPLFLQFISTTKACAVGSGQPLVFLYGDDPDDIDHCVVVTTMPNGSVGFSVHQDGHFDVQLEYVKSLIGPTYFAMAECHITRGPEEISAETIDQVFEQLKDKLKKHLSGECGCEAHAENKEPEQPQTELPLWVQTIMQEEKTDA